MAKWGSAPLRVVMRLPSAMQLNRSNMSGPRVSGPRVSANNPVARSFFSSANSQFMNRSITKGPWVSSFGRLGTGGGRMAQMLGERMSVEAFRRNAMQNANKSSAPIIKYRDPASGMGLNKFGNNQAWRFQQNNARQTSNKGYSSGMSQFAVNTPSGVGLNRMR